MTEYEVREIDFHPGEWLVQSTDDAGEVHTTLFIGPLAEGRARWYASHMNKNTAKPVIYPNE